MNAAPTDPDLLRLIGAILPHVAFDGWSETAFAAAVAETGMDRRQARTLCPRGAADLAAAYHAAGDAAMLAAVKAADLTGLRYRDKVAFAIRARLDAITDREAVRRGVALFALPHMAAEGARLTWGTADAIWRALGDTSQDVNWYTKRATLSAVWAAVVLYWLGDDSLNAQATDDFIARRIDDVMRIEEVKAKARGNALLRPVLGPLGRLMAGVKAPPQMPPADLPGSWQEGWAGAFGPPPPPPGSGG
jgi:ubiquinone biosynthesis protein COQ9